MPLRVRPTFAGAARLGRLACRLSRCLGLLSVSGAISSERPDIDEILVGQPVIVAHTSNRDVVCRGPDTTTADAERSLCRRSVHRFLRAATIWALTVSNPRLSPPRRWNETAATQMGRA